MSGTRIGEVTHYYDRIGVAVIQLSSALAKGDRVHFLGHGSDFTQEITSIQVEHETIESAKKGAEVAVKVAKPVKPHTAIFLITEEE
jgi:translation elongation factor EF-1alpha